MENIKSIIKPTKKKLERTLYAKQKWLLKGYTVVPNRVFEFELSSQALHLFLLLLRRLFRKDYCFPGYKTLKKEMNLSRQMIYTYKNELVEKGFLEVERRGLGKTNKYFVKIPEADVKPT